EQGHDPQHHPPQPAARPLAGRPGGHARRAAGHAPAPPHPGPVAPAAAGAGGALRAQSGEGIRHGGARAGARRRARRRGRLPGGAEPALALRHGAARRDGRHPLGKPAVAGGREAPCRSGGQRGRAARLRRHRRDGHVDAALGAGAAHHAQHPAGDGDRGAARHPRGRRLRGGVGPAARGEPGRAHRRPHAAQRHARHRALAQRRHRADLGTRRARAAAPARGAGGRRPGGAADGGRFPAAADRRAGRTAGAGRL
ncbi:MAG: Predicted L-lactate dehydrogenase, hypothetical protein subunit YkgG, partial [uncultured Acetobacteraceae bacterium]